ncbi:MAG TPA: Fur family transcriptional regulator [Candidatus Saccharimonadia bacterium]|nr:Fur family transcriptional regulator [Candidatus Saccharimonadia bacterium]
MTSRQTELKYTLKRHGQSMTGQRRILFEALQGQEPQSMAELVRACPGIDRASVYRNVSLFEKLGIIQRLQIGWKYKLELSDRFQRHHHHMTCTNCGRTIALAEDSKLETQLRLLAAHNRFKMKSHQLEIQGLCETCSKT